MIAGVPGGVADDADGPAHGHLRPQGGQPVRRGAEHDGGGVPGLLVCAEADDDDIFVGSSRVQIVTFLFGLGGR